MGLEIKKRIALLLLPLLFVGHTAYALDISTDFSTGLISVWEFLSGALTTDSTSAHTLTANGTPTYSSIVQSGGTDLELDNNQYYSLAHDADFEPSATVDYSFCFWFKPESLSGVRGLISKEGSAKGYLVYTNGSNIYFIHQGVDQTSSGGTLSTGTLYHICAVYDGASTDTLQLYVSSGGSADGTPSVSPSPRGYTDSGGATLKIGERSDGSGNSDGIIGQVIFWNGYALSAANVSSLYASGTGLPYTTGAGGVPALQYKHSVIF